MAVSLGVHVHFLREKQPSEQGLELHEHIVFIGVLVVVGVLHRQDVVSEAWDHEELLVKGVHVADAAKVFYSDATSR